MTKAILAAEADKIQDFIFRASRLREVSGGSAILSRFCEQMPTLLGCKKEDIVINDGGAFRLIFDTTEQAEQAGASLADLYYMATGCSLSVGRPVLWTGETKDFTDANEKAGHELRTAKRSQAVTVSPHLPQIAFCASTGIELAYRYKGAKPNLPANYISRYSSYKSSEWKKSEYKEEFIRKFLSAVVGEANADHFDAPDDAGTVGRLDSRDYVAYLVADGNGMGALFGQCQTPDQLRLLSQRLSEIVNQSLAEPTQRLYYQLLQDRKIKMNGNEEQRTIPVLPMILGGDDLFVLLPAPWAIAFAVEFCRNFEQKMNEFVQGELGWILKAQDRPTMSAALVLCKAKYPFSLAHQHGEKLLKVAKRLAKSSGRRQSTLCADLIVGNHLIEPNAQSERYRASLNPYYVNEVAQDVLPPPSIAITRLLDARIALSGLEQKRLAQLRTLFDIKALSQLDSERHDTLGEWTNQLHTLVDRISTIKGDDLIDEPQRRMAALQRLGFKFQIKREKGKANPPVEHALMPSVAQILYHLLVVLGGVKEQHYFRNSSDSDTWATAFPDLLDWWDYLVELPSLVTSAPTAQ